MPSSAENQRIVDVRSAVGALITQMHAAIDTGAYRRMRQLTHQMELLVTSGLQPSIEEHIPGVQVTALESRILGRLADGRGNCVSKESLMNAAYFDNPNDAPALKILDVMVCRLRKKLVGTRYTIETLHSRGFALKVVS